MLCQYMAVVPQTRPGDSAPPPSTGLFLLSHSFHLAADRSREEAIKCPGRACFSLETKTDTECDGGRLRLRRGLLACRRASVHEDVSAAGPITEAGVVLRGARLLAQPRALLVHSLSWRGGWGSLWEHGPPEPRKIRATPASLSHPCDTRPRGACSAAWSTPIHVPPLSMSR